MTGSYGGDNLVAKNYGSRQLFYGNGSTMLDDYKSDVGFAQVKRKIQRLVPLTFISSLGLNIV
jgi:hypothetical protein